MDLLPPNHLHLYVLMGQSNMVGRDAIETEDRKTHPRIIAANPDLQWVAAAVPLPHEDVLTYGADAGAGMGMTFARVMAQHTPNAMIGLIPCAFGGSPLSRWVKDGDCHIKAVARTKAAMQSGALKGILWQQGESDSREADLACTYLSRIKATLQDFRVELNAPEVPFVVGGMGAFLAIDPVWRHFSVIDAALRRLAQELNHVAYVSADGLNCMPDNCHLTAAAMREFGRRFASAMIALQK